MFIEHALQQETIRQRYESLKLAGKFLVEGNKDDFYSKMMGEMEEVNNSQAKYLKVHPANTDVMQQSLAEYISQKLTGEKMSDSKRADVHAEIRTLR